MDNTSSQTADVQPVETENDVPVLNPQNKQPIESYSMMHPKMRRIYGEFYREIYYTDGKVLDGKTQELISIAASLVAKCQGCIEGHMKKALELGATPDEISETISIAAAINAAAIIDLTDVAANKLNVNHFPSKGPRFMVQNEKS
ncbi:MAG: carboxymuconolactone decarboxylase family protein [Acidobacteriota bacterium]